MFKNAVETLNYFAEQCKAFDPIKKEFIKLQTTNENLTKELVNTKFEGMQLKQQNEMIVKELADTKILLTDALTTINNIKNGVK